MNFELAALKDGDAFLRNYGNREETMLRSVLQIYNNHVVHVGLLFTVIFFINIDMLCFVGLEQPGVQHHSASGRRSNNGDLSHFIATGPQRTSDTW